MLKKLLLKLGFIPTESYKMSFIVYQSLASQGNANAQKTLGYMYEYGKGIEQDYKKAKYYYKQACDSGLQSGCDDYERLNQNGY